MMLKQHKLTELLNNSILVIDTIKQTAINGFDDDYLNAYKSLEEIVELCDKLVGYIKQCNSLDKSPDLNNLNSIFY